MNFFLLQAWSLEDGKELHKTPLNKIGHFYSNQVHVTYYAYQKQSSLYTWMEGMTYIWIGAKVTESRENILKLIQEKLPSTEAIPKMQVRDENTAIESICHSQGCS